MIEVFKTNVEHSEQTAKLITVLTKQFSTFTVNFDLDDRDKILRVKGKEITPEKIITVLNSNGYKCSVLK